MDYAKLLQMQEELNQHIMKQHKLPYIELTKSVLATITELSEVAQEWRGFKYWSKHQEPRTESKVVCHACKGKGKFTIDIHTNQKEPCGYCDGTGLQEDRNPLLEEIADFTHFLANLSNRFKVTAEDIQKRGAIKYKDPSEHFLQMHYTASMIGVYPKAQEKQKHTLILWSLFKGLLEHLKFTEEQIFEAYLSKNEKNYERQANNY